MGCGILGIGHWELGIGNWALGIGHWALRISLVPRHSLGINTRRLCLQLPITDYRLPITNYPLPLYLCQPSSGFDNCQS
ncbi:MAG TPA: hypothetical protein DCS91_06060 [Microcoleaceae bacterium UBA11344]|nr:hypothetical protein [Microcoleaceae cyanobacterium UBA11344]